MSDAGGLKDQVVIPHIGSPGALVIANILSYIVAFYPTALELHHHQNPHESYRAGIKNMRPQGLWESTIINMARRYVKYSLVANSPGFFQRIGCSEQESYAYAIFLGIQYDAITKNPAVIMTQAMQRGIHYRELGLQKFLCKMKKKAKNGFWSQTLTDAILQYYFYYGTNTNYVSVLRKYNLPLDSKLNLPQTIEAILPTTFILSVANAFTHTITNIVRYKPAGFKDISWANYCKCLLNIPKEQKLKLRDFLTLETVNIFKPCNIWLYIGDIAKAMKPFLRVSVHPAGVMTNFLKYLTLGAFFLENDQRTSMVEDTIINPVKWQIDTINNLPILRKSWREYIEERKQVVCIEYESPGEMPNFRGQ